ARREQGVVAGELQVVVGADVGAAKRLPVECHREGQAQRGHAVVAVVAAIGHARHNRRRRRRIGIARAGRRGRGGGGRGVGWEEIRLRRRRRGGGRQRRGGGPGGLAGPGDL